MRLGLAGGVFVIALGVLLGVALFGSSQLPSPSDSVLAVNDRDASEQSAAAGEEASDELVVTDDGASYSSHHVLLSFDESLSEEALAERLTAEGIDVTDVTVIAEHVLDGELIANVRFATDEDPHDAAERIEALECVCAAHPDYMAELDELDEADLDETIDDPYGPAGQDILWGLDALHAYEAWDTVKVEGSVTVVIFDSGVEYSHPDLANNLVDSQYAKNVDKGTYGAEAVADTYNHGTHVAGIVAAEANNGIGVAGVSYNAKVLPIRVVNSKGQVPSSNSIAAIDYVVDLKTNSDNPDLQNIRAINMSYGGAPYDEFFDAALQRAHDAGIAVFCSMGNDKVEVVDNYPSSYDNTIAVSGLNSSLQIASWSSYGVATDLTAPGDTIYSTITGGKYGKKSGTSMSTPYVAGVAALAYSMDMSMTPDELLSVLASSACDLGDEGWDKVYGYGLVDAEAMLAEFEPDLERASVTVEAKGMMRHWTGETLEPTIVVRDHGTPLAADKDYCVLYNGETEVPTELGTCEVTIEGCGEYYGTRTVGDFTITELPVSEGVQYKVQSCFDSEFLLDAAYAKPLKGSNISIWTENFGTNQYFTVELTDDGYAILRNVANPELVLDAAGANPKRGANVSTWTYNEGLNQKWFLAADQDDSFRIVSAADNALVLDAAGESPAIGANVSIWTDWSQTDSSKPTENQRWTFEARESVPVLTDGTAYRIVSKSDSTFLLDAAYNPPVRGANIALWTDNGGANQLFTFEISDDSYYVLRNVANPDLVLDAAYAKPTRGANISTWTYNGGLNQKWIIQERAEGYYVFRCAANPSLVLDAAYNPPVIGANVTVWDLNDGDNQLWSFAACE